MFAYFSVMYSDRLRIHEQTLYKTYLSGVAYFSLKMKRVQTTYLSFRTCWRICRPKPKWSMDCSSPGLRGLVWRSIGMEELARRKYARRIWAPWQDFANIFKLIPYSNWLVFGNEWWLPTLCLRARIIWSLLAGRLTKLCATHCLRLYGRNQYWVKCCRKAWQLDTVGIMQSGAKTELWNKLKTLWSVGDQKESPLYLAPCSKANFAVGYWLIEHE